MGTVWDLSFNRDNPSQYIVGCFFKNGICFYELKKTELFFDRMERVTINASKDDVIELEKNGKIIFDDLIADEKSLHIKRRN